MSKKKEFPLLAKLSSFLLPYQVEQREGELTKYLEVVIDNGKMVMNTSKVNYSFGKLHTIFLESFKKIEIQNRAIKKVLVLGFGGGSVASMLTDDFNLSCKIIGIEADQVVIDLAHKHFNLEQYNDFSLIKSDAYDYVINCKEQFDLIAIDVFIDAVTPEKFSTETFINALNSIVSGNGLICYNRMIITPQSKKEAEKIIALLDKLDGQHKIIEYKMTTATNWMVVYENKKRIG